MVDLAASPPLPYDADLDQYVLSTGRRFYAHHGFLGVSAVEGGDGLLSIAQGFDGGVRIMGELRQFTPEERQEIAAHVISLWYRWARGDG